MGSAGDRAVRLVAQLAAMLKTHRGTDKTFRSLQYMLPLLGAACGDGSMAQRRLAKLRSRFSDTRCVLRLFGLVGALDGALHFHEPIRRLRLIRQIIVATDFLYHPLEHAWWAQKHQLIPMSASTADKCGKASASFWLAYIILDFYCCLVLLQLSRARRGKPRSAIYIKLLEHVCNLPCAVGCTFDYWPLPDKVNDVLGLGASLIGWRDAWNSASADI